MHLDARGIQRNDAHVNSYDAAFLQPQKGSLQNPALGPSTDPRVDGMPMSVFFRHRPPLNAVFKNVQCGIQRIQIADSGGLPVFRKAILYFFVLRFCQSLAPQYIIPILC